MKGAKFDLASSVLIGIICIIVAYFLCNFLIGEIAPQTVRTLKTTASSSIDLPSVEVFNYKAINPTVEAYIGECKEYNPDGTCIENTDEQQPTEENQ